MLYRIIINNEVIRRVLMFSDESERCENFPEVWVCIHIFPFFSLGKRINYIIYSPVRVLSLERQPLLWINSKILKYYTFKSEP